MTRILEGWDEGWEASVCVVSEPASQLVRCCRMLMLLLYARGCWNQQLLLYTRTSLRSWWVGCFFRTTQKPRSGHTDANASYPRSQSPTAEESAVFLLTHIYHTSRYSRLHKIPNPWGRASEKQMTHGTRNVEPRILLWLARIGQQQKITFLYREIFLGNSFGQWGSLFDCCVRTNNIYPYGVYESLIWPGFRSFSFPRRPKLRRSLGFWSFAWCPC